MDNNKTSNIKQLQNKIGHISGGQYLLQLNILVIIFMSIYGVTKYYEFIDVAGWIIIVISMIFSVGILVVIILLGSAINDIVNYLKAEEDNQQ